jgi:hypothetical protein
MTKYQLKEIHAPRRTYLVVFLRVLAGLAVEELERLLHLKDIVKVLKLALCSVRWLVGTEESNNG